MKKVRIACSVVFLTLFVSIATAYALSVSSSCTLKIGSSSAETNAVGISKSANFKIQTYSSSKAPTNAAVHACYTGWPYSLEQAKVVLIGETWNGVEKQDKDSNFFVKLWSMNGNQTYVWIYKSKLNIYLSVLTW